MIYYKKQISNPGKHPMMPGDYPWQISNQPLQDFIEIEETDYETLLSSFDLTEYNKATNPSQEEVELELQIKSASYKGAGSFIADEMERRVWARNTYLKNINQEIPNTEMNQLLSYSLSIQSALKTGSLQTAKDALNQLSPLFPKYTDINDWAVKAIGLFL